MPDPKRESPPAITRRTLLIAVETGGIDATNDRFIRRDLQASPPFNAAVMPIIAAHFFGVDVGVEELRAA